MFVIRQTQAVAGRLPAPLLALIPLILLVVAACSPGSGGSGPAY